VITRLVWLHATRAAFETCAQEREGPGGRPLLVVKGLAEARVASAAEALALIQQGQDNRKVRGLRRSAVLHVRPQRTLSRRRAVQRAHKQPLGAQLRRRVCPACLQVASTAYNDASSRSHTICRLLVEAVPPPAQQLGAAAEPACPAAASGSSGSSSSSSTSSSSTRTSAWLTLVDLAGSEGARAALSKEQQAEGRDINKSLLTLGKV
jgi:hypothetical protein